MLLAVCGLKREAAILAGQGRIAICGDAATLRSRLAALGDLRPTLVLSWGLCGGLDPALRPGDLLIGAGLVDGGERIATDPAVAAALANRLAAAGAPSRMAGFAAAEAPVLTAAAKAALHAATGAAAVDMESGLAARFARERGAPFAVLRAVSDPAERGLPALVLKAVDADGSVRVGAVARELLRAPGQLAGMLAAARDSRAAFATLDRGGRLLGLFLGLGRADL